MNHPLTALRFPNLHAEYISVDCIDDSRARKRALKHFSITWQHTISLTNDTHAYVTRTCLFPARCSSFLFRFFSLSFTPPNLSYTSMRLCRFFVSFFFVSQNTHIKWNPMSRTNVDSKRLGIKWELVKSKSKSLISKRKRRKSNKCAHGIFW